MTSPEGEFLSERMSIEEIAELLGVSTAAVRQQLSRGRFPQPVTPPEEKSRYWRRTDVYRYAVQQGGTAARAVPRVFSRVESPNPARFISNTMFDYPYQRLHLLTWLPSDGAGLVALAHPLNALPHRIAMRDLLGREKDLSAVAVVRGDLFEGPHGWETNLNIWDRGADKPYLASWSDLLQLLARPLPYWARGLRQRPAMLDWRPGNPAVALTPVDDLTDTAAIEALLEEVSDPRAESALLGAIRQIRSADTSQAESDLQMHPEFPGFQHAATVRTFTAAQGVDTAELSALLHQSDLAPSRALPALHAWAAHDGIAPLMDVRAQVSPGVTGLAAEWTQRLEPVPAASSRASGTGQRDPDELGYLYLAASHTELDPEEGERLHDPRHPDLWVVRVDGTYHYNVPSSMPAHGAVQDVAILEDEHEVAVFLRDFAGTVWPLPSSKTGYNVGYPGSGPYDLAIALLTLAPDASADLRATTLMQPPDGSWLLRQLTSPTGARTFSAEDLNR